MTDAADTTTVEPTAAEPPAAGPAAAEAPAAAGTAAEPVVTAGPEVVASAAAVAAAEPPAADPGRRIVFCTRDLNVYYGQFRAVRDVTFDVCQHEITALIGPSGCGKTTVLRCYNRMNDLIEGARVTGDIEYHGLDLYDERVDPVEVRRRIGMVFQKPNPFPKSIYENVAYGPAHPRHGPAARAEMDEIVENSAFAKRRRCGTR